MTLLSFNSVILRSVIFHIVAVFLYDLAKGLDAYWEFFHGKITKKCSVKATINSPPKGLINSPPFW